MEAENFVLAIRNNVIESNYLAYKELLENTTEATDPIWKSFLPLYQGMNHEQRLAFLNFMRSVQVSTVSQIFGILDGSSSLSENQENLILTTDQDTNPINGYLQDIFLEMEEEG